jgi:hypothetical protein
MEIPPYILFFLVLVKPMFLLVSFCLLGSHLALAKLAYAYWLTNHWS